MGSDAKRLAFVIPWRDRGKWIWEHLPAGFAGTLIFAAPEPETRGRVFRGLPYIGELANLWVRRPRWDEFDVIFTWELRTALATSLLRKLRRQNRSRFVVVGPILKGGILRVLPLVRFLLRDADHVICFSTAECDAYSAILRLPSGKFSFLPTPWLADESVSKTDKGYILALGHSGRDYPTLLRAVAETGLPLMIVAKSAADLGGCAPTANVTVLYNTGHHETIELIAGATVHCIPLQATQFSAGQTVLLRAMARGKAVVISDTPGIRDYVRDGETAVLVPVGDATALRQALITLWENPQMRAQIGGQAATSVREEFGFERFATALAVLADSMSSVPRA